MATPADISEDWEEVNDDNFSVVSFPASEDGLDNPAKDHISDSPVLPPFRLKRAEIREPDLANDVEMAGMDLKDVVDPKLPPPVTSDGTPDVDLDPKFLHHVITSLIKLIVEILGLVNFRGNFVIFEGAAKIRNQLIILKGDLEKLAPIMQGYSKHRRPDGRSDHLKLDAGIYEWMASFQVKLVGLQDILQNREGKQASTSQQRWDGSDTKPYESLLMLFSTQLKSFLPTLQAEYEQFRACRSQPWVFDATLAPPTAARIDRPSVMLRTVLYALKDQISACIKEFEEHQKCGLWARKDGFALANSYRSISSSLGLMLSYHAFGGVDHSMAGGIPYVEFCRLNPDSIRSYNLQLKEVLERLYVERYRVMSIRYMNDPDGLLDQIEADRNSNIDTLRTIEEALSSIFRVRKPYGLGGDVWHGWK
ncbi:hypothetical protein F4779DRAFT_607088 [Xylariaceae sp. FL0662B]|nr:hypothetical protein F4779DRAFT_607088 [Xylariaceae sp. FL0662B]